MRKMKWWQNLQRKRIYNSLEAVLHEQDTGKKISALYKIPHVNHVYAFEASTMLQKQCYVTTTGGVRFWQTGDTLNEAIDNGALAAATRALTLEGII